MNKLQLSQLNRRQHKTLFIITLSVMVLALLNLTQDFLRANINNTGYYFSESFIFSSFWWLFAPLLYLQYVFIRRNKSASIVVQAAFTTILILLHIVVFPLIVWILSQTFNDHTFTLQQTLRYTISEFIYLLIFLYAIPLVFYRLQKTKTLAKSSAEENVQTCSFTSFIVTSNGNKKQRIAVSDITYFTANAPYINMHVGDKKYLQNDTLKSISNQLNPAQFIRIHKSTIINIDAAASYTSRLNGDYEVTMKNGTMLRVSRNYAADFKQRFQKAHHLT